MSAKLDRCHDWARIMESAYQSDSWGQLDAADQYERVIKSIASSVNSSDNGDAPWTTAETTFLNKVAMCLKERVTVLQSPISKDKMFPKENVEKLIPPLRNLSFELNPVFPVELDSCNNNILTTVHTGKFVEMDGVVNSDDDDQGSSAGEDDYLQSMAGNNMSMSNVVVAVSKPGSLSPPLVKEAGQTLLEIRIDRIGLKDAAKLHDGYFTVSVKDSTGIDVTAIQETPTCGVREGNYIIFNSTIHIQKPAENLPKRFAIFFELKQQKNKYASVKCWSMVEGDELSKNGEVVCELYKKPTDFKRKRLHLLTKKELFLHLNVIRVT